MDKKIIVIIIPALHNYNSSFNVNFTIFRNYDYSKNNEKIGLVINFHHSSSVSLKQIDEIFTDASSTGIGRSNVYSILECY